MHKHKEIETVDGITGKTHSIYIYIIFYIQFTDVLLPFNEYYRDRHRDIIPYIF